jgi:hypothetical protein
MQIVATKKGVVYNTSSSIKMKIFSGSDFNQTESEVNTWLSQNAIRIDHICQSQCERNGKLLFLVSVFFTPLND